MKTTRYAVRERDGAFGVWDKYLLGWMTGEHGMSIMGEYDAQVLADDLNDSDGG